MNVMNKVAIACSLGLVCASGIHASELPDNIVKSGKLVIATNPNYPPIIYRDPESGKLTGVDIDIGEAIAAKLGLNVEWQEVAYVQMIPSLQTSRVDLAMAGMSDTTSRQESVDFVDYMKSGTQFFTTEKNTSRIKSASDLCGLKVGASRSTNNLDRVAEWGKQNCEAKGLPAIIGIGTEGTADARNQLKTGRIDAAVQGNETLPYFIKLEPGTYAVVDEPLTEEITGIPIAKSKPGLRDAVREAVDQLMADGTYGRILAKYGLGENAIPHAGINTGK